MADEDIIALPAEAEGRCHVWIHENFCERTVKAYPLSGRLRVVGQAIMERTDCAGHVLGRKLVAAADGMDARC